MDTDIQSYTPTELSVHEYVEARAQEMLAMASAAKTIIGNNLPLQKLPRHMRRRAASHFVKRLPRKMQSWAEREYVKAGPPSKNKRPSRKHRRRPGNLLEEYNRRKQKNIWLETHIWHAKRFHMTEKWGYRIALHPNDKGSRAAYRATSKYCLLQDMSYYACIEISGPVQDIIMGLDHLTNPDTGLTFGAKIFLNGKREGSVMVYCCNRYPYGVLGPVKYMWKCRADATSLQDTQAGSSAPGVPDRLGQIWIWTHPAMYKDFMEELKKAYGMKSEKSLTPSFQTDSETPKEENMCTDQQAEVEMTSGVKCEVLDQLKTFTNGSVNVTSLKDLLCRFQLTGPLSNQILRESLIISDVECGIESAGDAQLTQVDRTSEMPKYHSRSPIDHWWKKYFSEQKLINIHRKQREFWDGLVETESPAEILPHCIVGLTVRDPRKLLPSKKSMVHYDDKESCSAANECQILDDVSWSPLWQPDVRNDIKVTKQPDSEINALRSRLLVPGTDLPLTDDESRIPVLLIQNPGHQSTDSNASCSLGYGSGWDVIIPSGWSVPFLINFVYRGARVAGLKEYHSTMVEAGRFSYPANFPDSVAGHDWELSEQRQHMEKYEKLPPAKRINYIKLGVAAPFQYLWSELVTEWNVLLSIKSSCRDDGMENNLGRFYVLRSRSILQKLQKILQFREKSDSPSLASKKMMDRFSEITSHFSDGQCLVPVQISMVRRGHPDPFARICLPTSEDVLKVMDDTSYGGPLETVRKMKREEGKCTKPDSGPTGFMCSNLRSVIGFIKEGSFSYASGCGFGLGFVAYGALQKVLEIKTSTGSSMCFVLVRNTSSLHYRFAKLSISCHLI